MNSARKVNWQRLLWAAMVGVAALIGAIGSETAPTWVDTTDYTRRPINYGTLVNPDVIIKAADGSFTLNGGEQFRTPFVADLWSVNLPEQTLTDQYPAARNFGAKPVLVYSKGDSKPLHGLLVFNQAINTAFGPGSQSYYLSISKDKMDVAKYGGISVVYEKMDWKQYWNLQAEPDRKVGYGWILWLSATPI